MSSEYFIHHFFLCLMQEISFPIERAGEGQRERERERERERDREREREREANGV